LTYSIEHAHEAERAVLGTILLYPDRVYEAITLVNESEFTLPNQHIFAAMAALAQRGKAVDHTTLTEVLRNSGDLQNCGGQSYLSGLTDGVMGNLREYTRIVKEHAKRRRLAKLCDIGSRQIEEGGTTEATIAELENGLLNLRAEQHKAEVAQVKNFAASVLTQLRKIHDGTGELIGFTTGIQGLDLDTTGIRRGELWMVGALPGRGKTAFGTQVALANSKLGTPTAMFSLEMTKEQVLMRGLSPEAGVSATKIRNPRYMNTSDFAAISNALDRMIEWPLFIDDSSSLSVNELVARAKLYKRRYGVELFVVDYLRLVKAQGNEIRERVGNAADALRQLAKDENVAVVCLSQLRRPQDINDPPQMVDLKESGDVEAHAHCVVLLYQPVQDGQFTGEDQIIIGKQRNGPLGTLPVVFDKQTLTFLPRE
jgi:replicative DNA helicase